MPFKKPDPSKLTYARKVRIAADAEVLGYLDGQSKLCNWLWNRLKQAVESDLWLLRHGYGYGVMTEELEAELLASIYSEIGLRNRVPGIKAAHPFLRLAHSSPLKNVALKMAKAIAAHRQSKAGKRPGPPVHWINFKSWARQWASIEYDEAGKGWDISQPGWLALTFGVRDGERLKARVRLIDPPPDIAAAKTCRIVRDGQNRYSAIFTFTKAKPKSRTGRRIYLDPNHKNFAYGLDETGRAIEIDNRDGLREAERLSDLLKAKRDRCEKKSLWVDTTRADGTAATRWRPSRQWEKWNQVLERHEHRVREQNKHYLYGLANRLCASYDEIGIGHYVPENVDHGKGLRFNRAVRNRTLHGKFKDILAWVGARSGKTVRVLDEAGTTRTCHACDHVVKGGIHPQIRSWQCPACGLHHIRDENACQNGLKRMRAEGHLEMPGSGPVQVIERCDWCFHPQGWREVSKEGANVNQTRLPEYRQMTVQTAMGDALVSNSALMRSAS